MTLFNKLNYDTTLYLVIHNFIYIIVRLLNIFQFKIIFHISITDDKGYNPEGRRNVAVNVILFDSGHCVALTLV